MGGSNLEGFTALLLLNFSFVATSKTESLAHQLLMSENLRLGYTSFLALIEDMIKNTWQELEYRLDILWANKEAFVVID